RTMDPPGRSNSRSRSTQLCGVRGRVLNSPRPRSRLPFAPLLSPGTERTRSVSGESRSALFSERRDPLGEIGRPGAFLLDRGLKLQLVGHVLVEPVVELALGPGVGACRPVCQLGAQRLGPVRQLVTGPDLVDQPPVQGLRRGKPLA